MGIVVCLLLASLLSVQSADAQGCVRSRTYFGASTVHAPITYAAPAYVAPVYVTPRVVELYTPVEYYYSVQNFYRDQLLADAIAYRILSGQQGGGGIAPGGNGGGRLRGGRQPMTGADNGDAPPPLPDRRTAPPPEGPQRGGFKTAVDPKLTALVNAKCAECHNGTNPKRMDLSDLSTIPTPYRSMCFLKTNIGEMPKGKKTELTNEEVALFLSWYKDGEKAEGNGNGNGK